MSVQRHHPALIGPHASHISGTFAAPSFSVTTRIAAPRCSSADAPALARRAPHERVEKRT